MARGFPPRIESSPRLGIMAEKRVHEALLRSLDSDWFVYHSVRWSGQALDRKNTQGEVDFVVSHPKHGVFLLEVKSGQVFTEDRKWFRRTSKGAEIIKNPFRQLEDSAWALGKKYLAVNPSSSGVVFGWAAVFPDDDGIPRPLGPDGPPDLVITAGCLDQLKERFAKLSDYWSSRPLFGTGGLFRTQIDRIVRPEAMLGKLSTDLYAAANEADRSIQLFTARQRAGARSLVKNRRMSVLGGAGTGKTVLAIQRSIDLATCGYRTLLLTHSGPLARYLQTACEEQSNLTVSTFEAWLYSLVNRNESRTEPSVLLLKHDLKTLATELPTIHALEALSACPDLRWDAILIDEAQDFDDEWLSLVEFALASPSRDGEASYFLQFYDPCQSLRRRAPAEMPGDKEQILLANLRSTEQIGALVSHYHGEIVLQPHGPIGPDPVYRIVGAVIVEEVESVIECVAQLLKTDGFRARDIGVVCLTIERCLLMRKCLTSAGFSCGSLADLMTDVVTVDTAESFKGLDRSVIIVCEVGAMLQPVNRDALYVAITRARALLIFVGTKLHCDFVRATKWTRGVVSPFRSLS